MVKWTKDELARVQGRRKASRINIPSEKEIEVLYKEVGLTPDEAIFIPGEVPSAKNFKTIAFKATGDRKAKWRHLNARSGRWDYGVPFIMDSDFAKSYRKVITVFYQKNAFRFKQLIRDQEFPLHIEFLFVRRTKGRWDFNNLTEIVQDMMVECGWLEDDNVKFILPHPPRSPKEGFIVNSRIQGVFIKIMSNAEKIKETQP